MLVTKKISIKILHNNYKKYRSLGYELNVGDTIEIDIIHLSKGSKVIVQSKCHYCNNIKEIPYYTYNRSISKGGKFACSHKCADLKRREILREFYGVNNLSYLPNIIDKRKKTNFEKYGVECQFQLDSIKEKTKNTNLEKYGVDNYTKTDEYKEKARKTNLEKYGVEWYLQSEDKKQKTKNSNIEKYGTEFPQRSNLTKEKTLRTNIIRYGFVSPMMSEDIKLKSKETLNKNYGVDNPMKSEDIKQLSKNTNLVKYGFDHPMKSIEIKHKRAKNNIKKCGFSNISLSEKVRKNMIIGKHSSYIKYIGDKLSLFRCDVGHNFEMHSDNFYSRIRNNVPLCTICYPINNSVSIQQKNILEFISGIYKNEIIESYRDKLEIDIYLPNLKLGFEFNGLYWHSEINKDKNYHLNKTNYFKEKGIRIIHIWEDDWSFRKDIIKSQIKNWLGSSDTKISARKCDIRVIDSPKISKQFLDENHIQGSVNSVIKIGLYHDNKLVSIMTFDHNEGRKKMSDSEWNLSRFCNLLNTNIVGGASKLLSFFIKSFNPSRIISYADKDWSIGGLYKNMNFVESHNTNPDYKYIVNGERIHKSRFRKSKLKTNLTESQHMKIVGYNKIFDCGKIKFEKTI